MGKPQKIMFNTNIEHYEDIESEYEEEVLEYEVYVDVPARGKVEYGPYTLSVWEICPNNAGKERRLCLKETVRIPKQYLDNEGTFRPDHHMIFGLKISKQIVTMASLFLRRRVRLGGVVRRGNAPIMLTGFEGGLVDKALLEGESRLDNLHDYFEQVRGLDEVLQGPFLQAAMLYNQALQDIETQPTLAWLNLVSSIEILSHDFDVGEVNLSEINKGLATAVNRIVDDSLREEISNRIIKLMTSIRRRFVKFILEYLDESFWEQKKRPNKKQWGNAGSMDPDSLEVYLGNIYEQRSRALHDGEPFPLLSISEHPIEYAEISSGVDPDLDSLPHLQLFEGLVQHVLINYLKRHSVKN